MNEFKSFFKEVKGNEGNKCVYPTRLDTYGKGCSHDCSYCLAPDTQVMLWNEDNDYIYTRDIQNLKIGDEIVAFEENRREFQKAIVLNKWIVRKIAYKITLEDSNSFRTITEIIASGTHRFLTSNGWKEVFELTIKDILLGFEVNKRIISIEELEERELVDIETSLHTFIANGIISHNCYAKSLLSFRNFWNPEEPAVANISKIERKINKLPPMPAIRLGGMTDCFQKTEIKHEVTYKTIQALNKKNQPYLIVTKSDLVANDKYIQIYDKNLAHIQVTITCTDDDLYKSMDYEKAPLPSKRIKAVEKLYENDFDVQVRLSPYIPNFVDLDVLANIKCDKLLVEFLRVNSWIEKWFGKYIGLNEYIVKQSGYKHLPLEKKKELISKIYGFKEISVCEDESEAYEYRKNNFNPQIDDCCNLHK